MPNSKVLDIGTGTGSFIEAALKWGSSAVVGIEKLEQHCELCSTRINELFTIYSKTHSWQFPLELEDSEDLEVEENLPSEIKAEGSSSTPFSSSPSTSLSPQEFLSEPSPFYSSCLQETCVSNPASKLETCSECEKLFYFPFCSDFIHLEQPALFFCSVTSLEC